MAVIYKLRSGINKVHGVAKSSLSLVMSPHSTRKAGLITGISLLALTPALAIAMVPAGNDASSSSFTVKTDSASTDDSTLDSEGGVSKLKGSTSISIKKDSSSSTNTDEDDETTTVTVNGQEVVDENDDVVNKTIKTNSSSTNLKIDIKSDGSSYSKNSTSLQIDNRQVNNETQSDLRDDRTSAHR